MSIAKTPHIQTPASDPDPAAVPAGRLQHRDVRKMKIRFPPVCISHLLRRSWRGNVRKMKNRFTLCADLTCREDHGAGTGRLWSREYT